jgi:long-subunit acyl-CoA synthetase (AMP-forming)
MMPVATTPENAPYLQRAMARSRRLCETDPQVAAAQSTAAQRSAVVGDGKRRCIEMVQAACQVYAERPFIAERHGNLPYTALTYGALWSRLCAVAAGAQTLQLFGPGDFVGIFGFASADWVITDLACLHRCAVSVPLRTAMASCSM